MSKKDIKETEWNFKIVETPGIEYCVMCDAEGKLFHRNMRMGGIMRGEAIPLCPVEDVFELLDQGSIVADVFPIYGDIDGDGIDAYDMCSFMGCHFSSFEHVEDHQNPAVMDITIKQMDKGDGGSNVTISTHPLNWDKVQSEYKDLQKKYLHWMPGDDVIAPGFYIVRLYDITEPATVEILIEDGADIAADDYALFRIARERYPRLWIWLSEHYPKVIADHMNEIYGYDKKGVIENDFFNSFDNFIDNMIGGEGYCGNR